jgi:hypothetical protein
MINAPARNVVRVAFDLAKTDAASRAPRKACSPHAVTLSSDDAWRILAILGLDGRVECAGILPSERLAPLLVVIDDELRAPRDAGDQIRTQLQEIRGLLASAMAQAAALSWGYSETVR